MAVDLKHLSASTRDKVNKVRDLFADAAAAQDELVGEGVRVIMSERDRTEIIRVELLDPVALPEGNDRRGPEFGIGLDIGGGEET